MFNQCNNQLVAVPDITVYMNCDTCLAINLRMFDIGETDEFIFALKNYDYIDSGYTYLYKARKSDIDVNGEIIFKIPTRASKRLKPGAFYNFAVLANAYDKKLPTEYKKLTENGKICLEYGAQDMLVNLDTDIALTEDIIAARLATLDTVVNSNNEIQTGDCLVGRLKEF